MQSAAQPCVMAVTQWEQLHSKSQKGEKPSLVGDGVTVPLSMQEAQPYTCQAFFTF